MYLKDVSKIAKDVSKNISDKSLKIFDLRDTKSRSIQISQFHLQPTQSRDQQAHTFNDSLMAENPGYFRNGTDLQDPIRNRDVAQVRQRNEFEKKHRWREKGGNPSWLLADTDYRRKSHITADWS